MSINPLEGIWLTISFVGLIVSVMALGASFATWRAARILAVTTGTRALVILNNIRRESVRVLIQVALLLVAVPAVLRPGEIDLAFDWSTPENTMVALGSVSVLALMSVPVFLLTNSLLDTRERHTLVRMSLLEVEAERVVTERRIEMMLADLLTQGEVAAQASTERGELAVVERAELKETLDDHIEYSDGVIERTDLHQTEQDDSIADHEERMLHQEKP